MNDVTFAFGDVMVASCFVDRWRHRLLSTNYLIACKRVQDHDDDEEGGGGGGSSASKTFAKLKEMGAEMKVGMTKLAEKKVRMFQLGGPA